MSTSPRAIVVTPTPDLARQVVDCLSSRGLEVSVLGDFAAARQEIDRRPPCLIVTEIKLGDFNGLHLTLRARARSPEVAAIVIGEADCVLQAEALRQHVTYVVGPFEEGAFVTAVGETFTPPAAALSWSGSGTVH